MSIAKVEDAAICNKKFCPKPFLVPRQLWVFLFFLIKKDLVLVLSPHQLRFASSAILKNLRIFLSYLRGTIYKKILVDPPLLACICIHCKDMEKLNPYAVYYRRWHFLTLIVSSMMLYLLYSTILGDMLAVLE